MKKRKIAILFLLAACFGLSAAFLLLSNNNDNTKLVEAKQPATIELANPESITEFAIQNANGVFQFTKKEELLWAVNGESLLDNKADQMLEWLTKVEIKRTIENKSGALAEFGLNDAKTQVTILTKDQKEITIFIGNETATKEGYYFKKAGEDTIYIVSNEAAQIVSFSNDTSPQQTFFQVSLVNIEKLEYSSKSQQFTIARFGEKKDKNFSDYYIEQPFKTKPQLDISVPEFPAFIEFVNGAIPLTETEVKKEFGFAQPNLDVWIQTIDGEAKRIIVGDEVAEGSNRYFMKFNTSNHVYEMEIEQPDQIFGLDPAKLAIQAPVYAFINKIKKIEIEHQDKRYALNLEDINQYYVNNRKADKQLIKDLYLSLLELKADTNIEERTTGDSILTVSVTYADNDVTMLSYQDFDELFYSISQDGHTEFVIAKDKFNRVFELLSKIQME
ncbi:DUF4340 domain-containing protein [Neobacillus vireti]|uniref:DUF4340 domain-containing protein n=1 Tax=Neobacillus vireti TaxID=220686 RepID=UPI002FFE0AC2